MLFIHFLSALGLFLLGIWLMTEGLTLAGGKALELLLNKWTSSKPRGLASGILITTLVQSSSAVIIASIGFVNAGLMSFAQSVWVVFGSSLGSTFTGWLVALFGFKLDIGLIAALPVAIGAFLRLFAPYERGRFLGMALAGFGLMFMGIDVMKTTFTAHVDELNILTLLNSSDYLIVIGILIGLILTILTQASSAAIAIILTATASSVAGFEIAAAAVIGANIGTTSTSILAMLGATAGAKRLALAHVIFNTTAGILGLLMLPILLMVERSLTLSSDGFSIALLLVLFHTALNLACIIVMIPLEPLLSQLLSRFFTNQTVHNKPRQQFIDSNVAAIPDLALRALQLELKQLYNKLQQQSLFTLIYNPKNPLPALAMQSASEEISLFIIKAAQANLTQAQSTQFTDGLTAVHYLQKAFQALEQVRSLADTAQRLDHQLLSFINPWLEDINAFTNNLNNGQHDNEARWNALHDDYIHLKKKLLASTIENHLRLTDVDNALLLVSLVKRYVEQLMPVCALIEHLEISIEHQNAA